MNYVKIVLIALVAIFCFERVKSQELNAKLVINSDKLQGTNRDVFNSMQTSLTQLINERKWTDGTFGVNERIDCNFTITLSEVSDNTYSGDIQITSRRPVYNSSYSTTLFNFKDSEFVFEYAENESLEYNEGNITNNMVATVTFYIYIILGLDFDSFSLNGGRIYFDKAMNIANAAQGLSTKGWAPFQNDKNRYALALAFTEESSRNFHSMWYNYHRLGLDEMAANATRGRTKVITSIEDIQKIYQSRPSSPIIYFFGDTKLDELINVLSKATTEEKKEAYNILKKIYPTKNNQLDKLKQ